MYILWVFECSSGEEPINHSSGGRTIWNLGASPSVKDQFNSRGSHNTSREEFASQVKGISLRSISDYDLITIAAN